MKTGFQQRLGFLKETRLGIRRLGQEVEKDVPGFCGELSYPGDGQRASE